MGELEGKFILQLISSRVTVLVRTLPAAAASSEKKNDLGEETSYCCNEMQYNLCLAYL